jgi:hypothetical protein
MSATNRGAVRDPLDFYGTPRWATESILVQLLSRQADDCEDPIRSVLEPCAGTGAIASVLKDVGFAPWCVEIDQSRWDRCNKIAHCTLQDWLGEHTVDLKWDLILTNPPFSLALEFVIKAISMATCTVMLLPLNFMASKEREEFHKAHPSHCHVLRKRPSFGLNKHGKKGTDAQDYGWFQWGGPGFVPGSWEVLPLVGV